MEDEKWPSLHFVLSHALGIFLNFFVKGESHERFYADAKVYWSGVEPTVQGMLGGFSHISSTDIGGSSKFLRQFIRGEGATTGTAHALDCGAGIGRITKLLLIPHFDFVDMVELNQEFLDKAPKFLGDKARKVDRYICSGLQEFIPENGRYDVIWCQWVLGHLTDEDLVSFFHRCRTGLKENGIIFIKENIASQDDKHFDEQDSSFTRSKDMLINLIKKAGLTILKEEKQKNFPKEIYDVVMFATK